MYCTLDVIFPGLIWQYSHLNEVHIWKKAQKFKGFHKVTAIFLMFVEALLMAVICALLGVKVSVIPMVILFAIWGFTWGLRKK